MKSIVHKTIASTCEHFKTSLLPLSLQSVCVNEFSEVIVTCQWMTFCSVAAALHYHAVNEPVCMYVPGTSERAKLDSALTQFSANVHDVPVVIGDEEIRPGEPWLQPKVFAFCIYLTKKLFRCLGL